MITHLVIPDRQLAADIRAGSITFAGNKRMKIFGTLRCAQGKRMKRENRIFFQSIDEAINEGYRPCGHCMNVAYHKWKMDLFNNNIDETRNLLPQDGTVNYYGNILSPKAADRYLDYLLASIPWQHDEAVIFGKHYLTKRKVAWYADMPYEYTYSKVTKRAVVWTAELLELKAIVEQKTGERFNSCLLNLYHDGNEGMAWHSDGEKDLMKDGAIASLSLGAERKFAFRHKQTKETISLMLPHGSLLVMKDTTQTHWLHRLPPTTTIKRPRVNLTFRMMLR